MRKLLYIPMIHEAVDMGSLAGEMYTGSEKIHGKEAWGRHRKMVGEAWGRVEDLVRSASAGKMSNVRIYQDGLPASGEAGMRVVENVANMGSKNYRLIISLIRDGAKLEAAESRELLEKEYNYHIKMNSGTHEEKMEAWLDYQDVADDLSDGRDAYVAKRINETLKEGELGVAFFGGRHSIVDKLDADIKVRVLDEFKDKVSRDLMG